MGRDIALETASSGTVGAWRADPVEQAHGALVVVQEIFGVNDHIRSVVERYAAAGFAALAPAFFDPLQRGVELAYDESGFASGRKLVGALGLDAAIDIVRAATHLLQREGHAVGVVGFCWGGTVALLANQRLGLPAVSYYGARNVPLLDQPLRAPMQFHFGQFDAAIPAADVAAHRKALADAEIHEYPAGHAFNRDVDPAAYHADSARLAHRRTIGFFQHALG